MKACHRPSSSIGAKWFENWESYVAGRVGLMEAVRYARNIGLAKLEARVTELAQDLRDALSEIEGVSLHDLGRKNAGLSRLRKMAPTPRPLQIRFEPIGSACLSPL